MKKRNNNVIYFGMFFLAALIAEFYCILQFREDIITVAGVGAVLLIAAYLWMDSIKTCYINEMNKLDEKFSLLTKLQKAVYATSKKQVSLIEKNEKDDSYNELINELKGLKEEQNKLTKMLIKYNREDTKYIIAKNNANIERIIQAIQQLSLKVTDETVKREVQEKEVDDK